MQLYALLFVASQHFASETSKYASIHLLDASSRILSRARLSLRGA